MGVIRNSSKWEKVPVVYQTDGMKNGAGLLIHLVQSILPWINLCPLDGGDIVAPPPTGNGTGDYVDINQPTNDTWWLEGNRVTI